jgi:hypothetical protein
VPAQPTPGEAVGENAEPAIDLEIVQGVSFASGSVPGIFMGQAPARVGTNGRRNVLA